MKLNKKVVIGIVIVLVIIVVVGILYYVVSTPTSHVSIHIEDFVSIGVQEPYESPLGFHIVIHTTKDDVWLHDLECETYATLKNGTRIEGFKLSQDVDPTDVCYIQFAGNRTYGRRYVNASYIDIEKIEATLRTKEGTWTTTYVLPEWTEPLQEELDFTISGASAWMSTVQNMSYVPFRTGADELWNLTIKCLDMPSLMSWTNILLYEGYWDEGEDFRCTSEDILSIMSELTILETIGVDPEALEQQHPHWAHLYNTTTYTSIYGTSTPQNFTVFFAFPSSDGEGVGKFHVKLEKIE